MEHKPSNKQKEQRIKASRIWTIFSMCELDLAMPFRHLLKEKMEKDPHCEKFEKCTLKEFKFL